MFHFSIQVSRTVAFFISALSTYSTLSLLLLHEPGNDLCDLLRHYPPRPNVRAKMAICLNLNPAMVTPLLVAAVPLTIFLFALRFSQSSRCKASLFFDGLGLWSLNTPTSPTSLPGSQYRSMERLHHPVSDRSRRRFSPSRLSAVPCLWSCMWHSHWADN